MVVAIIIGFILLDSLIILASCIAADSDDLSERWYEEDGK